MCITAMEELTRLHERSEIPQDLFLMFEAPPSSRLSALSPVPPPFLFLLSIVAPPFLFLLSLVSPPFLFLFILSLFLLFSPLFFLLSPVLPPLSLVSLSSSSSDHTESCLIFFPDDFPHSLYFSDFFDPSLFSGCLAHIIPITMTVGTRGPSAP